MTCDMLCFFPTHSCRNARLCDVDVYTPLVQCMCQRDFPRNKLQDVNSLPPKEQSHSLHVTARLLRTTMAGPRNRSMSQARVSFELSMSSRCPGGSRKESTLHRLQNCHSGLPVELHRVELKGEHVPSLPSLHGQTRAPFRPHSKDK